jgi:predicted nuclease with RNAse H fold
LWSKVLNTKEIYVPKNPTKKSIPVVLPPLRRFIGVDLSGGKNDRTSAAVLDYYPKERKLFLTHVYEHIKSQDEISSDQALYEIISEHKENLELLCIDAPLKLPKCLRCELICPGYERCKEPEILWMWKQFRFIKKKRPRAKLFTPYTQRAAEIYINTETPEGLNPMETLGANIAPLTARAYFLLRRFPNIKVIEVYPKLSVIRIGGSMKVAKSHLTHYKHQIGGEESRQVILSQLIRRDIVFIYQQDFQKLVENSQSFDAFISAFTGFLKYNGQCEKPPKDYPISDGWIEFPVPQPDLF